MPVTSKLGEPDARIGRLHIWVHGRQFPDSQDYWDSNWLNVTAEYIGRDSRTKAHGAIITAGELYEFASGLEILNRDLKGSAVLECMEPYLHVEVRAKSLGHIEIEVAITADPLTESHTYKEQIDQTFLPPILAGLRSVLTRYPVRDDEKSRSNI